MLFLIDAYNVIFECGLQSKVASPIALQRARERLIRIVASQVSDSLRREVTLVFDSKLAPIKETTPRSRVHGIEVWYAVGYPDADTLIEELIRTHSTPKKLVVVSNDHRIQDAARRRQSTVIPSEAWMDDLERGRWLDEDADVSKPAPHVDADKIVPAEVASVDWLAEFESSLKDSEETNRHPRSGGDSTVPISNDRQPQEDGNDGPSPSEESKLIADSDIDWLSVFEKPKRPTDDRGPGQRDGR